MLAAAALFRLPLLPLNATAGSPLPLVLFKFVMAFLPFHVVLFPVHCTTVLELLRHIFHCRWLYFLVIGDDLLAIFDNFQTSFSLPLIFL